MNRLCAGRTCKSLLVVRFPRGKTAEPIKRGIDMAKISQSDRILQFIKENGSITRLQAANEIGAFELSARIVELERKGYRFLKEPIKAKNRYGETVRFTRYSLFGE